MKNKTIKRYARSARAINQWEKTRIRNLQYGTDRENEVSKIFIISLRLIRRAGKETSQSQAEGSTATKIAKTKSFWLLSLK